MLTPAVHDGGFLHRAVMMDRESQGLGFREEGLGGARTGTGTGPNGEADADGIGSGGLDPALPTAAGVSTTLLSGVGDAATAPDLAARMGAIMVPGVWFLHQLERGVAWPCGAEATWRALEPKSLPKKVEKVIDSWSVG